jgi:hypothetical protein
MFIIIVHGEHKEKLSLQSVQLLFLTFNLPDVGYVVAELVEALHYKLEGCRFKSQWGHCVFH